MRAPSSRPTPALVLALVAVALLFLTPPGRAAIGDIAAWQNAARQDVVRILSTGELRANGPVTLGDAAADTVTINGTLSLTSDIALGNGSTDSTTITGNLYANDNVTLGASSVDSVTMLGQMYANDNVTIGNAGTDSLTITAKMYANDNVTLGNASGDLITFTGRVDSDLFPNGNDAHQLGGNNDRWSQVWGVDADFDGVTTVDLTTTTLAYADGAMSEPAASPYAVLLDDSVVVYTGTGGAVTINLPAADDYGAGRILYVKDGGGDATANNITIDGDSAETIDGAATYVLDADYEAVRLLCTGTAWLSL